MSRVTIVVAVLIATAFSARSQSDKPSSFGSLDVRAVDALTQLPISFARLELTGVNARITNTCDSSGCSVFDALVPGEYSVTVTIVGYDTTVYRHVNVSADKISFQTLFMTAGNGLRNVVVRPTAVQGCGRSVASEAASMLSDRFEIGCLGEGDNAMCCGSRRTVYYTDGVRCKTAPCDPIESLTIQSGGVPAKFENAETIPDGTAKTQRPRRTNF